MVATVRLDSQLEATLNNLSKKFHKKRSDIIREAIRFYAQTLENTKKINYIMQIKLQNLNML